MSKIIEELLEDTGFMKAKKGHVIELGQKAIITDPCYGTDVWCQESITTKPGKYYCFYIDSDEGEWGIRISELIVIHEEAINRFMELVNEGEPYSTSIGVDSGQAGVFDYCKYEEWKKSDNDGFYRDCGNVTLSDECVGTVRDAGYVSSSGYGDGCYAAYAIFDEDEKAVGITIRFLEEEEED